MILYYMWLAQYAHAMYDNRKELPSFEEFITHLSQIRRFNAFGAEKATIYRILLQASRYPSVFIENDMREKATFCQTAVQVYADGRVHIIDGITYHAVSLPYLERAVERTKRWGYHENDDYWLSNAWRVIAIVKYLEKNLKYIPAKDSREVEVYSKENVYDSSRD